jgi:membrane-bound metal-dependent hydrolase YbcI (DUF457 family)
LTSFLSIRERRTTTMFLGHYAIALGAKRAAPNTSLGTLVVASQFIDLLWPLLLLAGVEHVRIDPGNTIVTPLDFYDYPVSHSLSGVLLWGGIVGGVCFAIRRSWKSAMVVGLAVVSHWVLDLVVHRPDLPLSFTGETRVGLGGWNSLPLTLLLELGLLAAGTYVYARTTKTKDRIGSYGLRGLLVFMIGIYFANLLGPPPPDVGMIGVAGNASWLFVLWAVWVGRHRQLVVRGVDEASRALDSDSLEWYF